MSAPRSAVHPRLRARVRSAVAVGAGLALAATGLGLTSPASADPDGTALVISEVYGGGGNSGATFTHDFLELYNPTDQPISVDGWSIQWRSAGSTSAGTPTPLDGEVPAHGHYLIQQAAGAGGTQPLPTPDATGTVAMGSGGGTALLVEGTEPVDPGTGAFAGAPEVVDLVGVDSNVYETAPAPGTSNTTSVARTDGADTDDNSADLTTGAPSPTNAAGEGGEPEPPEEVEATIPEIQGEGTQSPLLGDVATTEGVVTAAYPEGGLYGFYLQTPGTGGDRDPDQHPASDGIFVYQPYGTGDVTVEPGDHVQVTGTVDEYAGATQLKIRAEDDILTLDEDADPVQAVTGVWPATAQEKESLEGMLYRPTGPFTVTDTYATNQYGELGLARGRKPLLQSTDVARPGSAKAKRVREDNAARAIVLDDGSSTDFTETSDDPDDCAGVPTPCLVNGDLTPPYISNEAPVNVGARATFTEDVILTEGGSPRAPTYRFQPLAPVTGPDYPATSPATFENTRTAAPDRERLRAHGRPDLEVASFNVLNYFTTLGDPDDDNEGDGGCQAYRDKDGDGNNVRGGCDLRGAWDPEDLDRQQEKIVSAINALDADVVGLMEIENSAVLGEDPDEATEALVDALNADAGADVWAANPSSDELPAVARQDVITNAIIYRTDSVQRVGSAHALGDQSASDEAFGNAREPIAQAFRARGGGAPFLVVVNHFKSKGSPGPWPGDEDTGDGQGNSNTSRKKQAEALVAWVPEVLEEEDVEASLLVGDFNSYTMEDPMRILYEEGYTDAERHFGHDEYSYSYDGRSGSLDHVLVNGAALRMATGADIWNVNAGESVAMEYSRYNYHGTDFHRPGPYRSSDHDPVVLGLRTDSRRATHLTVRVHPPRPRVDRRAMVQVVVRPRALKATGTVQVRLGQQTYTGTVHRGKARVRVRFQRPGTQRLTVVYSGDAHVQGAQEVVRVRVRP